MPSFDGWSAQIRILHISDLHECGSREKEAWRRQSVLGDEFMQNLNMLSAEGPIDLVLFTGDLANFGLADEYEAATSFVDDVLKTVNLPRERFFSVPGNHDISREVNKEVWADFRERAGAVDQTELSRWLAGLGKPPLGIDGTWRDLLLEHQKPYRLWVRDILGRPEMDPTGSPHGFLGYRSTIAMEGIPFQVHVVGLDTAWLAGDDADAGKLRLTENQIGNLTHDINGSSARFVGWRTARQGSGA
jgi:predicted MPP superfamily phosphohydrolase